MEENQNVVSPINYLKIIFRRKSLFLVPLYAGLIIGVCSGILMPKKFQSSTIILVEEGKTDNPLFDSIAVSTTITQRLSSIQESMLGWNSLVQLVKRLNLDKDVKTPYDLETLILGIRKNIVIKLRGQNILDLSYIGEDPQQTQAVVKNITEIFIEKNVQTQNQETADAIHFIEAQLKLYEGKIKSAEIAKLQDELNILLLDSTDMHPKVKQLREQIASQKDELAKKNLEYSESSPLEPAGTNPIIDEIKKALNTMAEANGSDKQQKDPFAPVGDDKKTDLVKVMLIDKLDTVLARDVNVNTQIYNMLLQRLETAKITQRLQASKEGTKYTVLDPPRVPLNPVQPNRFLIGLMGVFIGALVGGGLVVAAEFLDKSFLDVEEAKEYLGVPLLGAISKINTLDSLRQERERQSWFASLTAIAGIIIVILTVVISGLIRS